MATVDQAVPPLQAGDFLSREEFWRRWEGMPDVKKAELIGGIVYMPSPLAYDHGDMDADIGAWLTIYRVATTGCASGHNTTTALLEDSPQPDLNLRILPEYGGASWPDAKTKFLFGKPELLVEICRSSTSYDLHQKHDLYQAAGIPESLAILMNEKEIRWHRLVQDAYQLVPPGPDGIWRSQEFPGLRLHGKALFAGDMKQVLATLQEGIQSAEQLAFVERLARKKESEFGTGHNGQKA